MVPRRDTPRTGALARAEVRWWKRSSASTRRAPTIREAQQADIERGWGQVEDQLLSWDTKIAHKAKRFTRTIAAVTGLLTVAGGAVGTAKGYVVKLWRVVHRGALPPPGEPEHNPSVASTTVDRVPETKPPGR